MTSAVGSMEAAPFIPENSIHSVVLQRMFPRQFLLEHLVGESRADIAVNLLQLGLSQKLVRRETCRKRTVRDTVLPPIRFFPQLSAAARKCAISSA